MASFDLSDAASWTGDAWRMVEAQHVASTMKLVDGRAEQDVLESLLEESKPALPDAAKSLDYLLATPFRYPTRRHGSRFRAATDPGVFYAAESEHTAAAELGYWRWRFLMDAPALEMLPPNAHTAFRSAIKALTLDLRTPRFARRVKALLHPTDYSAPQKFARAARQGGVEALLYRSVRAPEPGWCLALLSPNGFAKSRPYSASHTWFLTVSREAVTWRRDTEAMTFVTTAWQA